MTSDRLAELRSLIDQADTAYYTEGHTVMEDARYDALKDELRRLNPADPRLAQVGATVRESILQKAAHAIPMGSQSKATSRDEFDAWIANNLVKALGFQTPAEILLAASLKADGLSLSLEYRDGRLAQAITRGDGKIGEDVTANALQFKNLPRVCLFRGAPFSGYVRVEGILEVEDWLVVDEDQASNPRNCAAGIVRRKSGEQSDLLQVRAFRVFDAQGQLLGTTEAEQFAILKTMGFDVIPSTVGTPDAIWRWFETMQAERKQLTYWVDGVVVALNNLALQGGLGETDSRPKGQVAIKFKAEGATTVLRAVTQSVGHSGAIIPVGTFDPVQIEGTTVASATLCNYDNVRTLGVAIGDTVELIKAGGIIPRLMSVVAPAAARIPIAEPVACPECGGPVGRRVNVSGDEGAMLYCLNPACPAKQIRKIERYVHSLEILGIGDELLKGLVSGLKVEDAADLYTLHAHKAALANLKLNGKVRLGEKRAERILAEIEKRRTLTLSEFLGSLGILGLGKRRVALVQQAVPGQLDTLAAWLSGGLVRLAEAAGLPNTAERIQADLRERRPLIEKFLANGIALVTPAPKAAPKPGGLVICITGALSQPKAHYQGLIEAQGHTFTDTYSKTVTHLVAADPTGESSKLQKARKAGTPILSEADLLTLLHP